MDGNTIKVLEDTGYGAIIDATDLPYTSEKILVIDDGVPLCRDGLIGRECEIRSREDIMQEIDEKLSKYGFALVYFEMHDISDGYAFSEEKLSKLSGLLDAMLDGGYTFFTARGYRKHTGGT